jgi:hypothetical protein
LLPWAELEGKKDRIEKPEETLNKTYGTLLSKSTQTNLDFGR